MSYNWKDIQHDLENDLNIKFGFSCYEDFNAQSDSNDSKISNVDIIKDNFQEGTCHFRNTYVRCMVYAFHLLTINMYTSINS